MPKTPKPRVTVTVGEGAYRRRVRRLNAADRVRSAQAGLTTRADRKAAKERVLAEIAGEKEALADLRAKFEARPESPEAQRARQVLTGILPKRRERNGRLQRPTLEQLKRIEQARADKEKEVVLMQPHRQGDKSQECGSAFGRFILRCPEEHRKALKHAGDDYAVAVRGWRAAKGIPSLRDQGEPGAGLGPSDATIARWYRTMVDADRAMTAASHSGWLYVRQLVLDEYDIGLDQDGAALVALEALAIHFGLMRETRHPYA